MTVARSTEAVPVHSAVLEDSKVKAEASKNPLTRELSADWMRELMSLPPAYQAEYFAHATNLLQRSVRASFVYDIALTLRDLIWMQKAKFEEAILLAKLHDFIARYERWQSEPESRKTEISSTALFEEELFKSLNLFEPKGDFHFIHNPFELVVRSQTRALKIHSYAGIPIAGIIKAHSITVHALSSYLGDILVFLQLEIRNSPEGNRFAIPLIKGVGQANDLHIAKETSTSTGAKVELFWALKDLVRHVGALTYQYERYPSRNSLEEAARWQMVVRRWSEASQLLSAAQDLETLDWQTFVQKYGILQLETDENLPSPFLQRKRPNSDVNGISP